MSEENGTASEVSAKVAKPTSALAITGLVIGIVALLTSLLPIVNNASFFLAMLGGILALGGLVAAARGKRSGKALAIVALLVNIAAGGAVLGSQSLYSSAIDQAMQGPQVSSVSGGDGAQDATALAIGSTVELANGLKVTVLDVKPSSGKTGVAVSYENGGNKEASFNVYDWKAQDASGVISSASYSNASDALSSGKLAPGGSVTGTLTFSGEVQKVMYYSSMLADNAAATWEVEK